MPPIRSRRHSVADRRQRRPTRQTFLILLGAALAAVPAAAVEPCPDDARWGLVVDAGSSGSRLRLFCWRPGEGDALPSIEDRGSERREPGIADAECSRTPEEAVALLRPLVDFARETIGDPSRAAATPLSVLATAGLRQCPESYRARMLEEIGRYLETTPFTGAEARLIAGEEEGRYGWGAPWEDAYPKAYRLMQAIAPDKMTAMCEGAAIPNPDADLGDGARWLYALPWFAGGKANPPVRRRLAIVPA